MLKNYTSKLWLLAVIMFASTALIAQSTDGPIEVTSFADSTNITAGDNFQYVFQQGESIHVQGAYGNLANAVEVWVTYDVYAPDWSGLVYTSGKQIIANDSIGTLDGVIDFTFVLPEDAAVWGQFHEADGPVANHIIQVRVQYEPHVDTFWNIFIEVEGEETEQIPPLTISAIDGTDPAGILVPAATGESVNIMGSYVTDNVTDVTVGYLVFNPDWTEAYTHVETIESGDNVDGVINYDYTFPIDAPLAGSVDDLSDPNNPVPGFYLLQVRVNADPPVDVFYNANVEVSEGGKTTSFYLPLLEGLDISPNPALNDLIIETPYPNSDKHILIFNNAGQQVMETTMQGNRLDISKLQSGFHLIRVEQEGKVAGRKIMID